MSISIALAKGEYFAGERVEGVVTVTLSKEVKHKGVRIKVSGKEETHWEEQRTRTVSNSDGTTSTEHYTETYSSESHVLEDYITLFGPPREAMDSHDHMHMPPGHHTFPFSYPLPRDIPSSIEFDSHHHNHLRYKVKCYFDKVLGWFEKEIEAEVQIQVHGHTHPGQIASKNVPYNGSKSKTFNRCCLLCCFPTGPLTVSASIAPKTFFIPDERFLMAINVNNQSEKVVKHITVKVLRNITLHAQGASKNISESLHSATVYDGKTRFPTIEVPNAEIHLPPISQPSTCRTTRLIDIEYVLDVEVHMDEAFAINPHLHIPVLLTWGCCANLGAPVPIMGPPPVMLAPPPMMPAIPPNQPLLAPEAVAAQQKGFPAPGYGSFN